jgi:L-fucose isomerase-like protein
VGIPFACEGDVHGALTSLLVQGAGLSEKTAFCADMTMRHPENDNGELLWHCGCFPPSLAVDESKRWVGVDRGSAGVGNWEIKGGNLTIARFDADHGRYLLLIGEARGTVGPPTNWTYLWMEVNDWPRWEEKFIYGPYIHHCTVVHGRLAPVLYEACKYIPGVEPDLLDPTEEEIRAYRRGQDLTNGGQ